MMKLLSTLIIGLFSLACLAQPQTDYSSKNKKAIKLYEEAISAYNYRNHDLSTTLLNEAIEKDELFIEAYLLLSQVLAEKGKNMEAIASLEKAVKINPRYFPNAYYMLGEMYLLEGIYTDAAKNFTIYLDHSGGSDESKIRSRLGLDCCAFAERAIANPVDFDPINLGPGVNTENSEYYPCLTADDATLLFTREIPDSRAFLGTQEDFFVSTSEAKTWGPSRGISEINSVMNEGAPSLSHDGQVLIFTACEIEGEWGPGRTGLGSCDLFFSHKVGTSWSSPMNLGERINSYYWESQPSLAADGRTLYFVRGKSTARGIREQDIWVSHLSVDGVWQKPRKIEGEVNTAFEEESVMIHPDGETLYFSSNGHPGMGGLDIYMSKKRADGSWGKPVNLGYPINTHGNENSLLVSASGELAYFASDRDGGAGGLDLYRFIMPEAARPNVVTFAKGVVFDALSYKKLEASFEMIDLETGNVVSSSMSNPKSGEFLVSLPVDHDYALNVSREGYLFYSANFSLKDVDTAEPYALEVPLEKIKPGGKGVLNNIFFDTDSYALKAESKVELEKLVEFMTLNRHTRIEIGGHTDNVGSETANQALSENRAKSVVSYLVENGVEAWRLSAKGYGESQFISTNDTDEGRSKNRRTEFMIIE